MSWTAKKQSTVSRSRSEAEYRALATIIAELRWFPYLFRELNIILRPLSLFCDNLSALQMTHNPIFHARTRHIEIDYHFIRELVTRRFLFLHYISTDDQLADLFTKGLPKARFNALSVKLRLPYGRLT